jgi:GAF domain-containing protein
MKTLMPRRIDEPGPRFGQGGDPHRRSGAVGVAYAGIVLERLTRHACRIAGVDWCCIFVRDKVDPRLVIVAAGHGVPWDAIGSRFGADEFAVGQVLATGNGVLVDDCTELAGAAMSEGRPCSGAALPIDIGARPDGVLCAATRELGRRLSADEIDLLMDLSDLAAAALEHAERHEHYDERVHAHVEALVAAMDMRDRRTARHSEDVVALARAVGSLLELEPASLLELEFAARLHDVGKIRVPDAVLHKPAALDREEAAVIRHHSTWGAETLSRIPGLEAVATVVRFHHERWDGRGYPDRLRGARIPLASRIIAVCDAYGAMIADRPYRPAMRSDQALAEVRAGAGTQFDPAVVEALIEAIRTAASEPEPDH